MAFSHDAHCPEISPIHCADPDFEIIHHEHHQGIGLSRLQATVSFGLGQGWQAMAQLPFDVKFLTIEYTTPDGKPYDPPYGNIHHREETLVGPGDGRAELQRFRRVGDSWVLGGGIGSTIPMGRTEENPYALTKQGLTHQHIQMGGGTFDPVASLTAIGTGHQWGFVSNASGRLSLYENGYGFQPSPTVQVSAGPSYRVSAKLMATADLTFKHAWQATWDGEPDRMTGRTAVDFGSSVIYRFNPRVAVMGQGRTTLAQWSKEALLIQKFVGSVGVSFTPSGKAE